MTGDDARVGELLRRWVDDGAPAVTAAEARQRASTITLDDAPAQGGRGRRGLLVAAAAVVVLVVAAALVVRRGDRDPQVPVVTDTPTSTVAMHHYRVDYTDPALADQREHAEFDDYLHRGLVWTTRARLYAYGRIDATVEATEDGAALVSVVDPLTDDEQRLLLGTTGRLAASTAIEGAPQPCAGMVSGQQDVSGSWPAWTVQGCWPVHGTRPFQVGTTAENDPDLLVIDGAGPIVEARGDGVVVHLDLPGSGCATTGASCGGAPPVIALDDAVIAAPGVGGPVDIDGADIPVVDAVHGQILAAILAAGSYPGAVAVTDLGVGASPATMAPKHQSEPTGSTPDSPTTTVLRAPVGTGGPGAVPRSSDGAALSVSVETVGGPVPRGPQPVAGTPVVVEGNGQRATATTGADGRVTIPVTLGRWHAGPQAGVSVGVTVIVLTPAVHAVTLTDQIE